MPRILKDCFGTVISNLNKMKECVRCELLAECRSINWESSQEGVPAAVIRRVPPNPADGSDGAGLTGSGGADAPA